LSRMVLRGELREGDVAVVTVRGGNLVVERREPVPAG